MFTETEPCAFPFVELATGFGSIAFSEFAHDLDTD